ncbi:MAG: site-specific integrase [Gorillibacterium sp.]|nr:site-specific integrase [Gorillibacterium sp.]
MPIEQRGKSSWRLIVEAAPGADGRNQEKMTVKVRDLEVLQSKRKLDQYLSSELAKFQVLVDTGQYIRPARMSFKTFVQDHWKKKYADVNLGDNTRKKSMATINLLMPEFGHMELSKIKTMHIVDYFTKLHTPEGRKDGKKKPLATNTLLNRHSLLKSIFGCAKEWKIITNDPMDGVRRPVRGKKEKMEMRKRKKSYSPDEVRYALAVLGELEDRWRMYFIGVIMGGFRRGEMLGVEWPFVDFIRGGIHVDKQISFDEQGKTVETETKTIESQAFVPMPKFYMRMLEDYLKIWEQAKTEAIDIWRGGEKQFLFHNGFGEPLYPDAPTRFWGRLMKQAKLPVIRLHDLRHTTARLLREGGADTKSIQEILRHAREETTSNMYMEESEKTNERSANQLDIYDPVPTVILGTDWEQNPEIH